MKKLIKKKKYLWRTNFGVCGAVELNKPVLAGAMRNIVFGNLSPNGSVLKQTKTVPIKHRTNI